jgi:hypothetical protein
MDQEYVQLVNYVISKEIVDILIPLISGLIGTIIGGLISYCSIRSSDNRKWQQEKKDRLSTERREAIGMALEWFDPFRAAIMKARLLMNSYSIGMIDSEGVRTQWPDLLNHPGLKDLPPRLQVWLQSDTYKKAIEIVADLNNFVYKLNPLPSAEGERREYFSDFPDFFNGLDQKLKQLESELIEEYKRTFA